jgi:hypothetical protein
MRRDHCAESRQDNDNAACCADEEGQGIHHAIQHHGDIDVDVDVDVDLDVVGGLSFHDSVCPRPSLFSRFVLLAVIELAGPSGFHILILYTTYR